MKLYLHKITVKHEKRYYPFHYEVEEEYLVKYDGTELELETEVVKYRDKDIQMYYIYIISYFPKIEYNISIYKEDNESKTEEKFSLTSDYYEIVYI